MMKRFCFLSLMSLSLSVFYLSCAKAPHLKPGYESPEQVVDRYFEAMRWQDYEQAKTMVAPEAKEEFDKFLAVNSSNLKIVDHQVLEVKITEGGYQAIVRLRRSYIILPSVTRQQDELTQTWKLLKGKWLLAGPPF